MLTDQSILAHRTNLACCALSALSDYVEARRFGDKECADKARRLWLSLLWSKGIADRTPLSTETFGKCVDPLFAQQVFAKLDCFCDQCGCPAEDCVRIPSFEVIAAVTVAQRGAIQAGPPDVGDSYFVVSGTTDGTWAVPRVETWNGTGWDFVTVVSGEWVLVGGTTFWRLGQGGVPGPADPPVTATFVGPPEIWTIQSDFPSIAQNSSRTAYVLAFGSGGWNIVWQGPESELATPIPFPIIGYEMTNLQVIYVGNQFDGVGDCEYTAGGSIDPPGCFMPRDHDCSDHDLLDHS
jgi:hypothetical protein